MINQSIPNSDPKKNPSDLSDSPKTQSGQESKASKKKYLPSPFDFIYQMNEEEREQTISKKSEIQEIIEYAIGLEDKIEGDFDLDYMIFEFHYDQLAFIRQGLSLAEIKFLRLYKNFGDRTFKSFCEDHLRKSRWQVNDIIDSSRVCMELLFFGFEVIPNNISQGAVLKNYSGENLREAWQAVLDAHAGAHHKITYKSIRHVLFPPSDKDKSITKIQVPPALHEEIHKEAASQGWSIPQLISAMLHFFVSGGNSHLLEYERNKRKDAKSEAQSLKELKNINVSLGLDEVPY